MTDIRREPRLRLFIWTGFCKDSTDGMAFAIAKDETEARKLVAEQRGGEPYKWGTLEVRRIDQRVARSVDGDGW